MATTAQLEGQRRLAGLRRRVHRIRVRVACVAVVAFMAFFATIYVQMSRGQDPVLGSGGSAVATSTQPTATSSDTATSTDAAVSTQTATSTGDGSSSSATAQAAPMTTRQS